MSNYMNIEELHIPVILNRSKRRTLAVTVTSEGTLLVKAPFNMADKEIEQFLKQKRYWIYKQTKQILADNEERVLHSEDEIKQLKEKARNILTNRTEYYKKLVGVSYQKIRIGNQKTRWGSCSSRGTISYNWHLILMPEYIMDYVVVHELCHLQEMNHSPNFWKRVEEIFPDYQDCRRWLKENGSQYL